MQALILRTWRKIMYCIIDIGSNTMRLSCYRVIDQQLTYVFHKKRMAGLASYVEENGNLSKKGLEKAIEILNDFKKIIQSVGIDTVYIIATASFRNVNNTQDILTQIKNTTDFDVEVLSGKEEAVYDFIGASYLTASRDGMVVDIGGGSTELVFYSDGIINNALSLPFGSLNLYSKKVAKLFPKKDEVHEIRKLIKDSLDKLGITIDNQKILGVGGTNRAVCKLYNEFFGLPSDNKVMKCSKITKMLHKIREDKRIALSYILQIVPERIHTIIPGMIIMDEINKYYQCNDVEVSSWGVKEGYLIQKLLI
jgi:exopolyphosphatase/guanosine-5'-triphosphate,3'-diphosphate pyrophosphatase